MRKNSNSDLQSRLKTRKVLGVGEVDDGECRDVYRSKISQILGHSDHLYMRMSSSLFYWHICNVAFFCLTGLFSILFPQKSVRFELGICGNNSKVVGGDLPSESLAIIRLYGSGVLVFGLVLLRIFPYSDRNNVRYLLFMSGLLFALHSLVSIVSRAPGGCLWLTLVRCVGVLGNAAFYELIGPPVFKKWGVQFWQWCHGGEPDEFDFNLNKPPEATELASNNVNTAFEANHEEQKSKDQ